MIDTKNDDASKQPLRLTRAYLDQRLREQSAKVDNIFDAATDRVKATVQASVMQTIEADIESRFKKALATIRADEPKTHNLRSANEQMLHDLSQQVAVLVARYQNATGLRVRYLAVENQNHFGNARGLDQPLVRPIIANV